MTVEAAFVLPLFLFFFLTLSSAMELLRLHGNLTVALWDIGNRVSVYGYLLQESREDYEQSKDSLLQEFGDLGFSYGYVKKEIIKYVGKEYLDESLIAYGSEGLTLLGGEYFNQKDLCEIVVTYRIDPPYPMVGFSSFLMENHYYGHLWTGYEIPGTGEAEEKIVYYYVTENSEVYHCNSECSHLKLTKEEVNLVQVAFQRNQSGGKYTPCEKCKKYEGTTKVWISKQGDHYHYREDCPGLKRTVYRITEQEIGSLRPCSRCGNSS